MTGGLLIIDSLLNVKHRAQIKQNDIFVACTVYNEEKTPGYLKVAIKQHTCANKYVKLKCNRT